MLNYNLLTTELRLHFAGTPLFHFTMKQHALAHIALDGSEINPRLPFKRHDPDPTERCLFFGLRGLSGKHCHFPLVLRNVWASGPPLPPGFVLGNHCHFAMVTRKLWAGPPLPPGFVLGKHCHFPMLKRNFRKSGPPLPPSFVLGKTLSFRNGCKETLGEF